MKLTEKCVFGVTKGKLLGCMISERGVEANPEKVEAIRRMKAPRTLREVQKLAGRLVSLNIFISRSAKRALPFFKAPTLFNGGQSSSKLLKI